MGIRNFAFKPIAMVTLTTKAKVTRENHQLILDLENKVVDGEYDVVVTLQQITEKPRKLELPLYDLPIGSNSTYNREEIYGDNGR